VLVEGVSRDTFEISICEFEFECYPVHSPLEFDQQVLIAAVALRAGILFRACRKMLSSGGRFA